MTVLTLENVTLQFPTMVRAALQNISYDIHQGDFVMLLGSNGSGKTSLLKLLYRYYFPTAGQIRLKNKCLQEYSAKELSRHVSVLTQNCNESLFTSLTVYENYLLVKHRDFFKRVNHADERAFLRNYLYDYNPQLAEKLNSLVSELSGGEKQALSLALCLLNPPSLLLLDEHTSALDPKTSAQIMQITAQNAAKYNITCMLTTHNLEHAAQFGNRLLVLREGEIVMQSEKSHKQPITKEMLTTHYY